VLTARVAPPGALQEDADLRTFGTRLLERVRSSGRSTAGLVSHPFGGDFSDSVILAEGYQPKPGESLISLQRQRDARPFEAMGISLVGAAVQQETPGVAEVDHRGRSSLGAGGAGRSAGDCSNQTARRT
jgi:hypothetical protein